MKILVALIVLTVAIRSYAAESTFTLKPSAGRVQIEAVGRPAMVKIKGAGEGPRGTLKVSESVVSGEIQFALDTLDTGIDLRNEHMKEKYLETSKYPHATLNLQEVALPNGWSKEKPEVSQARFKGELTLHGEKRPIEGTFEITSDKELNARMELKISDYKIDIPSYLGITVADTVKVQINSKEFF